MAIMSFLNKDQKNIKKYGKLVAKINKLEPIYEKMSDEELQSQTAIFKERLEGGETVFDIQTEAFAVVREAAKRVLGMRHYDVQLIGGLALSEGNIAEMATGEGKTLVASLPSYLRALEGKGVHVITVNDYLASRDCEQIGRIHEFLGLTVGLNVAQMDAESKRAAYQADITYGVGTEFGFDYLRDNMSYSPAERVQRPFHFVIVDEVDSVLIDEAKTPLIIAGKTGVSQELGQLCARIVKGFEADRDFLYDHETNTVNLTEEGMTRIEKGFSIDNLYDLQHQTLYHYVIQALRARMMFKRDVDYIVKDGEVVLIDMFTGRPMEGRTLSNGLHQAIEAKEGLEITEENQTQASITIQNYFRMYPVLSGMTGTAKTEEKEFQELYGMDVVQIPTNRPIARKDEEDRVFMTIEQKYRAMTEEVKRVHATGQPILIGTTSILQSEKVAEYLDEVGLDYHLLNAKSIEQEVQLISLAGQKHHITIATNMAGRGTDIMLGEGVAELGGLFVLGTERHESRRIDNQLKGRSGRQGDPGRSQFFISLEDEMFKRFAKEELEKLVKTLKPDANGQVDDKRVKKFVERTQRICEGSNFGIREYNLKLDNVVNEQRNTMYKLRNMILNGEDMLPILKPMVRSHVEDLINDVCKPDIVEDEWELGRLEKEVSAALMQADISFPEHSSRDAIVNIATEAVNHYLNDLDEMIAGPDMQALMQRMLIAYVDTHWLEHINDMEHLKEGIGLRSYSQEDPMRQYEREGLELFKMMYAKIEADVAKELSRVLFSRYGE